jgi:hypothetical protein
VVLALDYPGERQAAHIADARLEEAGIDVRYVLEPPPVDLMDARAYVTELVRRIDGCPCRVGFVISYCVAAPLAVAAATAIAARTGRDEPRHIMFDAVPGDPAAVLDETSSVFRQFELTEDANRLTGPGRERLIAAIGSAGGAVEFFEYVRRTLRQQVAELVRLEVADDDGPLVEEYSAELLHHYLGWLCHLLAAYGARGLRASGDITHVVSSEHELGEGSLGSRGGEVIRVDCARTDLLRADGTRAAVLATLADRATAAATNEHTRRTV